MNFLPVPEVKYTQKSPILGEFEVNVHGSLVKDKMTNAYSRLQKRVTLPGFRAGKVPLDLVKKKYQGEVLNDVFNELVNETYRKGATEHKVRVAGDPYITKTNIGEWKEGETLNYVAQVDLIPDVELKKYKGLPIKKKEGLISDEDVDVVIKNLLDPKAELENLPAETKVAKGMLAVIDFEGKLDGEPLADASATNFFLEVGAPNSLEDFQNGLMGMKAGEEKTIPVKYPEDYKNTDVAGKEVIYKVKLHEVKQKKFPELTDELAKEFQADTAADLRGKIRTSLEAEMKNEQRQQNQEEALLALVEQNDFEVPPSLVQRQLQYILQEVAGLLRKQQFGDNLIQDYLRKHSKDFEARAAREVKLALLLPKVVEAEKIKIGDADLKTHYEEIVKQSGQKMDAVEKFYNGSAQHKDDLTRELERRKALDALVSNAKAH